MYVCMYKQIERQIFLAHCQQERVEKLYIRKTKGYDKLAEEAAEGIYKRKKKPPKNPNKTKPYVI